MATEYYTRSIDAGRGRQNVTVVDGIISSQKLVAMEGRFTGDGNPELIDKDKSALRGMEFRKVKGPQAFNDVTRKWYSLEV